MLIPIGIPSRVGTAWGWGKVIPTTAEATIFTSDFKFQHFYFGKFRFCELRLHVQMVI
jgi:hypothetical protein